ncbi:hypothetical protein Y032_0014g2244 [Ancylostoma ceylanicum]|uniref:Uncharacterized protein n=1 Tax=Ancylostoma ceylanicum TaxID=53326 RepID=A0A016V9M0_9BILA|nr:hypothetical protein Y032_0014g2244 [Ancylostoma ceylanicum]
MGPNQLFASVGGCQPQEHLYDLPYLQSRSHQVEKFGRNRKEVCTCLEYPQTSPAIVAIATTAAVALTAGGRHMDKVNEETPDERGMIIKGEWQSIGILPIIAITHIATSLWAHPREYRR